MTAALAPVRETRHSQRRTRRGSTKHLECWAAETLDGQWELEREDSPGTPWLVIHKPTKEFVDLLGTLDACRAYVAAGHAQAALERIQAHNRGEHAAARDSWCVRC